MPIKKELLEILACPACRGDISYDDAKDTLNCNACHRRYPIRDDIPVMLVDEATIPDEGEKPNKS
ncbi:MAG TPA: Trm112 family protein [Candidatus Ozemobacteraceae bacterium]|nr:Trm112 family protein [Candidatus Ozemobacteraceae bacterium]